MSHLHELFLDFKRAYTLFEDDLSRKIFLNCFLYYITDEYKYIDTIVDDSVNGYKDTFRNPDSDLNKKLGVLLGQNKKLIIYGAGYWGRCINYALRESIFAFCDRSSETIKHVATPWRVMDVISPDELIANKNEYTVLIGTLDYYDEVNSFLVQNSIEVFDVNLPQLIEGIRPYENHYFDEKLIEYTEDEVFIDAGCWCFETSEMFIKKCNTVKKIYAFEPDAVQYPICVEKSKHLDFVSVLPFGLWNENTKLSFFVNDSNHALSRVVNDDEMRDDLFTIDAKKLDDILCGERVTFIKMDIEGAELNALEGAAETIKMYKPKLAISLYHKPEDIIEIPLFIHSLVSEYRFYIRHYSTFHGETVLYALHDMEVDHKA